MRWSQGAGTYILVLDAMKSLELTVGCLGTFNLPAGRYAYVGSARGPGGLHARLARHLGAEKRRRWHIDYLTEALPAIYVYAKQNEERQECAWVRCLLSLPDISVPVPRFGSSDCREGCPAHLLRLPDSCPLDTLKEIVSA
jgi:Uri superfamily endonuclease